VELGFKHLLHPGESTPVRVRIKAVDVPTGPVRGKHLTVPSNDPQRPIVEVPIRGDIFEVLKVDPPVLEFGTLSREKAPPSSTVKFRPGADSTMKLVRVEVTDPATFEASPETMGTGFGLTVRFKDEGFRTWAAAPKPIRTTVLLTIDVTSPDKTRTIRYPLRIQAD
jgi:hypothetical protein